MPIAFDFLGLGEIRIKGTKIKKVCNTWVARKVVKNTFLTRHRKYKINSDHKNGS
jgi:hypothetical protein